MITVPVSLGDRSYDVLIGRGARHSLGEVLPVGARRAAVVTQAGIPVPVDPGIEHQVFTMPPGEEAKTMATVEDLCRGFSRWGLTRSDVVVAVGGGVVTDTAGFAAAVYHRGVAVVHVATTLLGQVDAAIGGKTGVNVAEGKNLIGAFWQPAGVICDTGVLETLPPREYRSGLGEMVKYQFLGTDLEGVGLDEQVARCVALKAAVVGEDEREGGRREILNYGHTLAHALETAGGYDLRHGEAVAVGLMFAAHLAAHLGRIDEARVADHQRILQRFELPHQLPAGAESERLLWLMARDKKATAGLKFVLDGPSGVEPVTGVTAADVTATLTAMGAS